MAIEIAAPEFLHGPFENRQRALFRHKWGCTLFCSRRHRIKLLLLRLDAHRSYFQFKCMFAKEQEPPGQIAFIASA